MEDARSPAPPGREAKALCTSLEAFGELLPAERILLDRCCEGGWATLGDLRPNRRQGAKRVRASFIRFLLLCTRDQVPVHEHGVALRGAWIEGALDLDFATIERRLSLVNCRMEGVQALHAQASFINLSGCRLKGQMVADGLRCDGFLFLRDGFEAWRGVRLLGAVIGGDLDCSAGRFCSRDGEALSCDRISVKGRVTLKSYPDQPTPYEAVGAVSFDAAVIEGDLDCTGAVFRAPGKTALSCVRAKVGGRLILQSLRELDGGVDLTLTETGSLCDDAGTWTGADGRLVLDGLRTRALPATRRPTPRAASHG